MKKSRFKQVIRSGTLANEREFIDINKLVEVYPFWSTGFVLLALNAEQNGKKTKPYLINAALRVPDRSYLKDIFYRGYSNPDNYPELDESIIDKPIPRLPADPKSVIADTEIVNDDIFIEIEQYLTEIARGKKQFEDYLAREDNASPPKKTSRRRSTKQKTPTKSKENPPAETDEKPAEIKQTVQKNKPGQSTKPRKAANTKTSSSSPRKPTGKKKKEENDPQDKGSKSDDAIGDQNAASGAEESKKVERPDNREENLILDYLQRINQRKEEQLSPRTKAEPKKSQRPSKPVPPEEEPTEKVEEPSQKDNHAQFQIIDNFLKHEPKIAIDPHESYKNPDIKQEDLSKPYVEFSDDLVSENLATILIKQGKTQKAIDIYRKLIWKFPQKKAYFADQIKKLEEEEN